MNKKVYYNLYQKLISLSIQFNSIQFDSIRFDSPLRLPIVNYCRWIFDVNFGPLILTCNSYERGRILFTTWRLPFDFDRYDGYVRVENEKRTLRATECRSFENSDNRQSKIENRQWCTLYLSVPTTPVVKWEKKERESLKYFYNMASYDYILHSRFIWPKGNNGSRRFKE